MDGLIENRDNIMDQHVAFYDSQVQDIASQLWHFGIHIEIPTGEEEITEPEESPEVQRARKMLEQILHYAKFSTEDAMTRFEKIHAITTQLVDLL